MPYHASVVEAVDLVSPSDDVNSPSEFVQRAQKLDNVELAVRTAGRYDAMVWIHPEGEGHRQEDALASAMDTALEIQGFDSVEDTSLMVWRPDEDAHGSA